MIDKRKRQKVDKTLHIITITIACLLFLFKIVLDITYGQSDHFKYYDEIKQQESMQVTITGFSRPGYKLVSYAYLEYTYEGETYDSMVLRAAGDYVGKKISVKYLPSERRYVRSSFVFSYNTSRLVYLACGFIVFVIIGSVYNKRRNE